MPNLDGFEICKRIKGNQHNKNVKIIAMTGFPGDDIKEKILTYGADAFIEKPIEIDQLKGLVANVLS